VKKKASNVIILLVFCVWITVIIVCLVKIVRAERYSMAYGNFPRITITDDSFNAFSVEGSGRIDFAPGPDEEIRFHRFGAGDIFGDFGYSIKDGCIFTGDGTHNRYIDIENSHVFRVGEGKKIELNKYEISALLLRVTEGTSENVKFTAILSGEQYKNFKGVECAGEYEGVLAINKSVISIPCESTDFEKVRAKVIKEQLPHLIFCVFISLLAFAVVSIPLIALAKNRAMIGLLIYFITMLVAVIIVVHFFCDMCYSAIGVNYSEYFW